MNRNSKVADLESDFFQIVGREHGTRLAQSFMLSRASLDERLAAGRALRKTIPRSTHAEYVPASDRADTVALIASQNLSRVAKLVPVRNARMVASPFSFLRGSAVVMAADLARLPRTGLEVAANGDMHVANFGLFGSAERNLVFAINDFDEVHVGPWEWDLKRLAASAYVAAQAAGGDRDRAAEAARAAAESYVCRLSRYARMGHLAVWYDCIDRKVLLDNIPKRLRRKAERMMARASERGHLRTLDKLTENVDGAQRMIEDQPFVIRETLTPEGEPVQQALDRVLAGYLQSLSEDRRRILSRYRIVDVVRKVVGVGSVGLECWVIQMEGRDDSDPLFLQVKEARASVLAPYVKGSAQILNQGKRVVIGQRMIQGSPDIFLGWGPMAGGRDRAFYVRQLADMKGGARFVENAPETLDGLTEWARLCGWALALAHAKSGDAATISGYCGTGNALPEAISAFAGKYADQTMRDHAAFHAAVASGKISADQRLRS